MPTSTKCIHISYFKVFETEFILGSFEGKLCLLDYRYRKNRIGIDNRLQKHLKCAYLEETSPVIETTKKELSEYFNGERQSFSMEVLTLGTAFQNDVWDALRKIPYAQTCSYLELAQNIDNEKAVRAVANANGANALSIIIPCHRIIGKDGTLTGYAGGLDIKRKLLELEGKYL